MWKFRLRGTNTPLRKRRNLLFFIDKSKSNIPLDAVIYWKVKNTGKEAANIGQLRGEIIRDWGKWCKDESTAYEGTHYVECYAVKDYRCIARDRLDVPIGRF
jgi:predicted alpha/beta hydrolase